ncbi:MAG: septum formation initiator family protein [Wenzhouxiangella sp.]
MRWILLVLLVLVIAAQLRLWGELRDVRELRVQLQEQLDENERLRVRNDALAAEVDDLRGGLEALEERARSELGLIREDEEFFLIVDPRMLERRP